MLRFHHVVHVRAGPEAVGVAPLRGSWRWVAGKGGGYVLREGVGNLEAVASHARSGAGCVKYFRMVSGLGSFRTVAPVCALRLLVVGLQASALSGAVGGNPSAHLVYSPCLRGACWFCGSGLSELPSVHGRLRCCLLLSSQLRSCLQAAFPTIMLLLNVDRCCATGLRARCHMQAGVCATGTQTS